jgi:succinate-semialdehyde dehydrogenase/glutarate-semialdehyde dehydrogenase
MIEPNASSLGEARAAAERLRASWLHGGSMAVTANTYRYASPAFPALELEAADLGTADALKAAAAARGAEAAWAATPAMQRAALVRALASELKAQQGVLAEMIVLESGKTMAHAQAEVGFALSVIDTLLASVAETGSTARSDYMTGRRVITMLRPVGPALLITPWNFPLNLGTRKLATALLAGCTVVWKPSDRTPLTALLVAEATRRAGLPDGVVSVIPTHDSVAVVGALMGSGMIRKLSFTGSTGVGKALMAQAADQLVRVSLELGGNGPAIVAPSADIDAAADAIVRAKFASNGQVCTTVNRLYVPRGMQAEMLQALASRMDGMRVAWPHEEGTDLGPVISRASAERLGRLVTEAEARGATVTRHGALPPEDGDFVRPTIVSNVTTADDIVQEELFGPVLPVIAYDELDDAIRQANSTPYGLSSYVFASDSGELEQILAAIRSGLVAVNGPSPSSVSSPFGGVGWSGIGRENGTRGMSEFQDEISFVY